MKHLEDLARQRVDEAIQTGLRLQQVKRQLGQGQPPTEPVSPNARRLSRAVLTKRLTQDKGWWGRALRWAAGIARSAGGQR